MDKPKKPPVDEHLIHLWTPFTLKLHKDYNYLHTGLFSRLFYWAIRALAIAVFSWSLPLFLGLRIRGRENLHGLHGYVTVCNHVHILDCVAIGLAVGWHKQYFITLQSNMEIFFLRHLVRLLGGLPIPRELGKMSRFTKAVHTALTDRQQTVHIYPEAVLHPYYDGLRDFHRGAFVLTHEAQVPLVPMVITFRKPDGLYRLFKRKPLLTLTVLPPICPDSSQHKRQDATRLEGICRTAMQQEIDKSKTPPV